MSIAAAIFAVLASTTICAWVISFGSKDSRLRERAWEKKETAWAQERQQLLDRIMYLADRPWEVPEQQYPDDPEPIRESYDPMDSPIASEYDFYPQGVV